jgi:hypothetical protein
VRIQRDVLEEESVGSDWVFDQGFACNRALRLGGIGTPSGATVLEQLTELYRIADEIDAAALARLLGVTRTWLIRYATRPKKRRSPWLTCKEIERGARMRTANNRLLFDLDDISAFVAEFEELVTNLEAPHLGGVTLPLVSATDPRIGTMWNPLEAFRSRIVAWQHGAVRRSLGTPIAFHISTAGFDYCALWPEERGPLAVNDNLPVTQPTCGGAKR